MRKNIHLLISAGYLSLGTRKFFGTVEDEANRGKKHIPVFSGNLLFSLSSD